MTSSPTADASGPGRVRASDAEREEVAQLVRDAVAEGRLDLTEGEERLATVYAVRHRDELNPLVADLPAGQARLRPAPASEPAWRGHRGRRGWPGPRRAPFGVFALVAVVLLGVWAVTGAHGFWPVVPLLFLTFALVRVVRWRAWVRRSRSA